MGWTDVYLNEGPRVLSAEGIPQPIAADDKHLIGRAQLAGDHLCPEGAGVGIEQDRLGRR